ncbi:MAG: hypothetical protein WC455_12795 [Dehalococcoidia bacterium]|jgi:hypothetical protein
MQAKTLQQCIQEAKRFIQLAEAVPLRDVVIEGEHSKRTVTYIESGKASGAMKRASMDLSRCLSALRGGR